MTKNEVQITKEIANFRIHVETAIKRIKYYQILEGTLPFTTMQHVD